MENVDVDELKEIKEREMSVLKEVSFVRGGSNSKKSDLFWRLWPSNIDDDVDKLNEALVNFNKDRKDKYLRVIKTITKSEFLIFI